MVDTLLVNLSGDASAGVDAQAVIDVNGVQVGGVLDVSAVNAIDNVETFTLTGNFGANPTVSISFINNNTIATNAPRTLYVDGFTYDGVAQYGNKLAERSDQTASFNLSSSAPVAERASTFLGGIGVDVHIGDWNLIIR